MRTPLFDRIWTIASPVSAATFAASGSCDRGSKRMTSTRPFWPRYPGAETFRGRSKAEFGAFFDGLELIDPGIVSVAHWRAEREPQPRPSAAEAAAHCAVARVR